VRDVHKATVGFFTLALAAGAMAGTAAAGQAEAEPLTATAALTSNDTAFVVEPASNATLLPATHPLAPAAATPKPQAAPGPAAPAASKRAASAPCSSAARACIDLSANRSWLLDGAGNVTYGPVRISHGRPGWRTPTGTFQVQWKDIDHKSRMFNNAPMPYSVFFNGGIAFHAGNVNQQSHGCIRLSTAAARKYYNSLRVGDIVQVVP
jgi:lipoprotein-anchoring transpeptidase ErfK/SrfK